MSLPPSSPKRERNMEIDYLRVLCTCLIVCLHVTGIYIARLHLPFVNVESVFCSLFFLALSAGLPPFFMISGAFMISKEIDSVSEFYRRSFSRILPWSTFFFFIISFFKILNVEYHNGSGLMNVDFISFYCEWFKVGGRGVWWFIPALMGLYLITPFLVWVRKHSSLLVFCVYTAATFAATRYLIIPFMGADYASYDINWFKGIFFIGHYMLGYCIYTFIKQSSSKWCNASIIGALFVVALIGFAIWLAPYYTGNSPSGICLNAQQTVPIILGALLFAFFSKVSLPKSHLISAIASLSLIIYLSHNYLPLPLVRFGLLKWTGLWDTVYRESFLLNFICYAIAIPFSILFAFALQKGALYFNKRLQGLLAYFKS